MPATSTAALHRPAARPTAEAPRGRYLQLLTWAFTFFNTARLVSYLPTLWVLSAGRDSSQHSLWTWGVWLGANLTMSLWLFEQQQRRWTRAVVVNAINAAMCGATMLVILVLRF